MPWTNFWGSSTRGDDHKSSDSLRSDLPSSVTEKLKEATKPTPSSNELLTALSTPTTYTSPPVLIPTLLLTTVILSTLTLSRRYLTRIPSAAHIPPSSFRHRSIFGRVTSVGDADNFRLYHTPGGRLAGWGWLRRLPTDLKGKIKVKSDETVHIRIAGVDAPELAHFGQPAQPYGQEALSFLKGLVEGRRVRVFLWRPDQYGRAVGTVYVRRWFGLLKTDVGDAMLRAGMATIYEAKTGAEFGGKKEAYSRLEVKAQKAGKGLWSQMGKKGFESPRQFKDRNKEDAANTEVGGKVGGILSQAVSTSRSWFTFWK